MRSRTFSGNASWKNDWDKQTSCADGAGAVGSDCPKLSRAVAKGL
jgi:hypothetical protein